MNVSLIFIELGLAVIGLALLARLASRWGFSAIPLYLLAGLSFGNGGLMPLNFSEDFIHVGAEIGVLLLLFMLGLEYTGSELKESLRRGLPAGLVDLLLNFPPGLICGFILGWQPLASILLGGVTYISSSGVIAKVLNELGRMNKPETSVILSILVIEDLAMAVYLPLVAVLLIGQSWLSGLISILIALVTVSVVLFVAVRYGENISHNISHESNEIILLTTFGMILLIAGIAQRLQVSAAIGAFLVGIAISGPIAERAHDVISPLRDLFAATFFFFFGLQIDPATLPPVILLAVILGLITALTKILAGWWGARRAGIDKAGQLRAGSALVARGEFSIVIAGLGVNAGLDAGLGPLATAYVLFMVLLGPILSRFVSD
ncbi:MAG TPA: cation:proton antiporter [Anaerolineales bacterium]|nr:cation:proton antiporter [Anaerolineales bacterium]